MGIGICGILIMIHKEWVLGFVQLWRKKTKVGDPSYHHLSYLDISFQGKLKSEKGLKNIFSGQCRKQRFLDRPK